MLEGNCIPVASWTSGNESEPVHGVTIGNLDKKSANLLDEPFICLTVKEYSIRLTAQRFSLPAAQPPISFLGPKILTSAEQSVCNSKCLHNKY